MISLPHHLDHLDSLRKRHAYRLNSWVGCNKHQINLQERIKNANKTYFMLQKIFRNKNISKKLKLRLKSTIIDKTLTYASETWILTKRQKANKHF